MVSRSPRAHVDLVWSQGEAHNPYARPKHAHEAVIPWVYEALLERDLRRDESAVEGHRPLVAEFIVQEGSRFDGKQVHELGLPAGCVLVTVHRDRYEVVPTPNTSLEVGNRLTVVIAPQAIEALAVLREGCGAPRARGAWSFSFSESIDRIRTPKSDHMSWRPGSSPPETGGV